MTATTTARLSLLLSVITLAFVASIALRPPPAELETLSSIDSQVTILRGDLEELRDQLDSGADPGESGQLTERFDRVEAVLVELTAKLDAICGAIESSPFAPGGFACP